MIPELDELTAIAPDGESQLTKGQRIEQWLTAQWEFRYNEVKHVSEYRKKEGGTWKPLDNYYLNTIKRQLRDVWYLTKEQKEDGTWKEKKTYLTTTVGNLHETIESNFSPRTDVIKDYLQNLQHDGYDGNAINQLAATVKLAPWYTPAQTAYWHKYLRKWLVATVANAMEDYNCKNHVCLVLVGDQGLRKGFWIEHLIQDAIGSQYVRTDGNFDPHKKDCLAAIGTYWLIHLDDMLKGLNMKDADSIKHAITCPDVKIRLPYQRMDMTLPHRASFIATVNEPDFITDTTGARRFMPFEISSIDWAAYLKVNKHEVWTEAMRHYANKDLDYWISHDEEKELKIYKEHFAVEFTEEGLLLQHFRPWREDVDGPESNSTRMTATMMLAHLMKEEQVFRNLSDKRLGALLRKHGFQKRSSYINGNSVKAYMVKLIHDGDKRVSESSDLPGLAAQRLKDQRKAQAVGAQGGIDLEEMEGDGF